MSPAFLPAPVLYGTAIDTTCIIWGKKCGRNTSCHYYNMDLFRQRQAPADIPSTCTMTHASMSAILRVCTFGTIPLHFWDHFTRQTKSSAAPFFESICHTVCIRRRSVIEYTEYLGCMIFTDSISFMARFLGLQVLFVCGAFICFLLSLLILRHRAGMLETHTYTNYKYTSMWTCTHRHALTHACAHTYTIGWEAVRWFFLSGWIFEKAFFPRRLLFKLWMSSRKVDHCESESLCIGRLSTFLGIPGQRCDSVAVREMLI